MSSLFINTKWLIRAALACIAIVLFAMPGFGQSVIERLVEPGKLSEAHTEFEPECDSCHESFRKSAQSNLCRDCHDEIDLDMRSETGFHGKHPNVSASDCKSCHTEHIGRAGDIVGLDVRSFDHDFTDYPLAGGHVGVDCAACHTEGQKYSEAPSECWSCHQPDDPHDAKLGRDCASCHVVEIWSEVEFDHDTTEFPLLGGHSSADCMSCHDGQIWSELPTDCASCHQSDDVHNGRFGARCGDCHSETDWSAIRFDHNMTGFELRGRHATTKCESCHKGALTEPLSRTCLSCHQDDDIHDGLNGDQCENCHTFTRWTEVRFDHDATDFPLRGGHAQTSCETCHVQPINTTLPPVQCVGCHADDDNHNGVLGNECATCHNDSSWTQVRFEHSRDAGFDLIGAHADTACESCHQKSTTEWVPGVACADCHADDDPHAGQMGNSCSACHGQTSWTQTINFNHDFSRFPLLGKHEQVECESCHESTSFHDAPLECFACHREEDAHDGALGTDCASCHNPTGWRFWQFEHDTQTAFPLTGKHAGLNCAACHSRSAKNNKISVSSRCVSCHVSDDKHRGSFGRSCDRCHTTEAWWAVQVQ